MIAQHRFPWKITRRVYGQDIDLNAHVTVGVLRGRDAEGGVRFIPVALVLPVLQKAHDVHPEGREL
jgi:hypothetical protein